MKFFFKEDVQDQVDWRNIEYLLRMEDEEIIRQYFGNKPQLRLLLVFNEEGYSLVHLAVLYGLPDKIKQIVKYAQEVQHETQENIKQWINCKTFSDKYTALHLASYKGIIEQIQYLLELGADSHAISASGLSMLHVAAQGDQATSLYIFKQLGLDINFKDKRGGTPLHWACFSKGEEALSYLLAWKPNINTQDQEGSTPLHIAIQHVQQINSTRIRPQSKLRCLMFKAPIRPMPKNPMTLIVYFLFFCYSQFLLFSFVYLRIKKEMCYMNLILTVACLIYFFLSYLRDPGYLVNKTVPFRKLLETFDPTQLCPDCEVIRTARSRHCSICQRCVERFDHHCPWINNCVGVRNHVVFLIYVILQHLLLIVSLLLTVYAITIQMIPRVGGIQMTNDSEINQMKRVVLNKSFFMFNFQLSRTYFFLAAFNIIIICSVFLVPLTTTNERFSKSQMNNIDQQEDFTRINVQGIKSRSLKHANQVNKSNQGKSFDNTINQQHQHMISSLSNCDNKPLLVYQSGEYFNPEVAKFRDQQMLMNKSSRINFVNLKQNCFSMCFEDQMRTQAEIYEIARAS
eukprot:403358066